MNVPLYTAGALLLSGALGGLVYVFLLSVKEVLLAEKSVAYVRAGQIVVFTRAGDELRESWDDHPYRVLFRSASVADQELRMQHRDEVLTRQGFVPQQPWRELFEVDAAVVKD